MVSIFTPHPSRFIWETVRVASPLCSSGRFWVCTAYSSRGGCFLLLSDHASDLRGGVLPSHHRLAFYETLKRTYSFHGRDPQVLVITVASSNSGELHPTIQSKAYRGASTSTVYSESFPPRIAGPHWLLVTKLCAEHDLRPTIRIESHLNNPTRENFRVRHWLVRCSRG